MPRETLLGSPRSIGSGTMRAITGTDPAAGSDFLETVPAGVQWRIVSIRADLVTNAVVIGRIVKLSMDGGAAPRFYSSLANGHTGTSGQPASLTDIYIWATTGAVTLRANFVAPATFDLLIGLPPNIILGPGMRFFSETVNLQAGDDWAAPEYLVEEWEL